MCSAIRGYGSAVPVAEREFDKSGSGAHGSEAGGYRTDGANLEAESNGVVEGSHGGKRRGLRRAAAWLELAILEQGRRVGDSGAKDAGLDGCDKLWLTRMVTCRARAKPNSDVEVTAAVAYVAFSSMASS